jgi:UV DNA damage endonuclease
MRIGYACLTVGVPGTSFRTCLLKNASDHKLAEVIAHNLDALDHILDYNHTQGIRMFRITSDLIPFGSSPVNRLAWPLMFAKDFSCLGRKIKETGLRVSMHPGQYTVLNSPDPRVVQNAIADLEYHARVLELLGVSPEHKIILHIGGVYGDKKTAAQRFIANYRQLEDGVRQRLVIENDDRSYTIEEVLGISAATGAPAVFDNLHHAAKPSSIQRTDLEWIRACRSTWQPGDGLQKIHYSQQAVGKRSGAHSESIRLEDFAAYYESLEGLDLDIMLEVKDKNLSALRCIKWLRSRTSATPDPLS